METDLLRAFFTVVEQGSLNRAAERLRLAQSTLTRQMRTLEEAMGGRLLERGPAGVAPTAAGHALIERAGPALDELDRALGEVRRRARGQSSELRVGYLMSAATDHLSPALAALRRAHPEVKVKLRDLSPGEQIAALRRGELDVALLGAAGRGIDREFYVRKLAVLPVLVALPAHHALVSKTELRMADLRGQSFIGAPDSDLPGHDRWITALAKRAGFRARFVASADGLTHGLALVVAENAVALIPDYAKKISAPGVVLRPLRDAAARWDFMVAWQRGKTTPPLRVLLDALAQGSLKP